MDVIMVDLWMLWGTDDVWVDIIMVLAHGCIGERMRFGCTLLPMDALGNELYGLPMDASGQAGNYQVFTCLLPPKRVLYKPSI